MGNNPSSQKIVEKKCKKIKQNLDPIIQKIEKKCETIKNNSSCYDENVSMQTIKNDLFNCINYSNDLNKL